MADEYARNAPARGLRQALSATVITQNLRFWLVAVWSFALGFAVNWQAAALWGCAAAAASVVRGEAERRLSRGRFRRPAAIMTAVATSNGVLWVIAPLLAWNTGVAWSQMVAVSMVLAAILMVFTQFGHRLRQAAIASLPYAAASAWFAVNMRKTGEFWPFVVCVMVLGGAMFANVLFWRVNRALIERYQANQARLIGELEEARDTANAANAAKSAFLAMISHELRTPMNGVLGAAQLLEGAGLTSAQRRYVEMIRTSGDSLLTLLNDILDFAKIESGRVELEAIEIDLAGLIDRVAAIWSAKAESKGLDYVVAIDPQTPAMIVGDPTRLSQIVHNLLSNATKFTDAGSVSLTVSVERLEDERARIAIAVADTGLGISAADHARLFQPFSQLDSSSTRRFGGTGLGLAISRRLAEMIGGGLHVVSEPGRGSVFTLTADVEVTQWYRPDAALTAEAQAQDAARPLNVLVAEDHAINRKLLLLWLEMEGHRFTSAENGQAALELSASQAFDVILMDVNMPVMDGLAAVRALRERDGANRETPVVMLSASARVEDHDAGYRAGANAYLNKPIDFGALRETLAELTQEPTAKDASAVA
jgi:signal transduction histidine kinase/ActR/RegA family two-component response regulator